MHTRYGSSKKTMWDDSKCLLSSPSLRVSLRFCFPGTFPIQFLAVRRWMAKKLEKNRFNQPLAAPLVQGVTIPKSSLVMSGFTKRKPFAKVKHLAF